MKRFLKIFLPILLAFALVFGSFWYLFVYDRDLTLDVLLYSARYFESNGQLELASQFYDLAYVHGQGSDEVAIELAQQYMNSGNFTQAEVTLNRAIRDGGSAPVYVALSKTYVAQDKLMDAVDLLDNISNPEIKAEVDKLRPKAPTASQAPGFYNQYISVSLRGGSNLLYVNAHGEYPSVESDLYKEPVMLGDGENILYAISVSESGLVSPLSIFGYTVGGVIEKIDFQDPLIEKAIRSILMVSDSKVLYSNDLWDIQEFTVPEGAGSYADLRHLLYLESLTITNGISGQLNNLAPLTALTKLSITHTSVSDKELEIIGSLTGLKDLTLDECSLSTLNGLQDLTGLTHLSLNSNAIGNLTPISGMTKLIQLDMEQNALQDLTKLTGCTSLQKLNVAYNSIADISPLSNLHALRQINISHNLLTDISGLQSLRQVQELNASHNKLTNLNPLTQFTNLSQLDVSNNSLTELSPIAGLDCMTYLNFSYNQVTALPTWPADSKLVTVDGSYNQISDLSSLAKLEAINNIFMDYNPELKDISMLAQCHVLIQVNVYGTKVKDVKALTDQSIVVNYNPLA